MRTALRHATISAQHNGATRLDKAMPIIALIDCNNFFVSCERIFRPDLEGKPVVVLSSNDGCAVARSNEAKALGIPMAAPAFQYRDTLQRHRVVQFSANFDLYGDISRRITSILTAITPRIEVYSVDESFLQLDNLPIENLTAWGETVRQQIWQWVGMPVSIGIAPTKTLAKLASDYAKKHPEEQGVLDLYSLPESQRQRYLQTFPIEDVWGVGRRLAPGLRAQGIATADQLRSLRPQRAQQLMGIHGRQMVAELNGTACHGFQKQSKPCQTIATTRTFGGDITDTNALQAALTTFVSKASYRLRRSNQLAQRATLFLATNKHKPGYRRWQQEIRLAAPTNDAGVITTAITAAFRALHASGRAYHRAGVVLYDFVPQSAVQMDLAGNLDPVRHDAHIRRMRAMDSLNQRFGSHTVQLAAEQLAQNWRPQYRLRSPRYTTHWPELPVCRITQ
ncbi:hypothetical protein CR970_03965 [Candidatus Saccharibacteria bacterium]|nr:MAG: hypothetical protein CR970_03965 [Candidatus Saccharibacteria bacterium]